MPRTPLVSRPIGRASDSGKRIAIPLAVATTSSSPGRVITATSRNITTVSSMNTLSAHESSSGTSRTCQPTPRRASTYDSH